MKTSKKKRPKRRRRIAEKQPSSSSPGRRDEPALIDPPWQAYVADVLAGEIEVCRWVRLACERHERDLKRSDIYFEDAAAWRVIRFLSLLRHYKGKWAGEQFVVEPWQAFIIASLFGWKRSDDGLRRYQTGYVEVPRKNGKTLLGAGLLLYLLVADEEAGAEAYSAATKEDQAKIVWKDVEAMISGCCEPAFIDALLVRQKPPVITHKASRSEFKPLSREAKSYDGLNPHAVLMDELHAWPESAQALWDVLDTAVGARTQPLILQITTAGDILEGVCRRQQKAVQSILNQTFENDSYFGIIYTLDDEDLINEDGNRDLTKLSDPRLWAKANPNWNVSVLPRAAEKAYKTASAPATATQGFQSLQTKRFNIWVNSATAWLSILDWERSFEEIDAERLKGLRCFGGLDLAQVRDHSALALLFPPQDGLERFTLLMRYWCPEENIDRRAKEDSVPYRAWLEQGHLTATPGRVTDYRWINKGILEASEQFDLESVAFDRTFSGQIVQNLLDEGVDMVQFGQGYVSMSAPCKEFERMVIGGDELNHLNHPILKWNAENAIVLTDPAGNIKIDKSNVKKRVDGLVAAVMALGLAMVDAENEVIIDGW